MGVCFDHSVHVDVGLGESERKLRRRGNSSKLLHESAQKFAPKSDDPFLGVFTVKTVSAFDLSQTCRLCLTTHRIAIGV